MGKILLPPVINPRFRHHRNTNTILAMEVSAVCGTQPRTPPREEHDGENPDADEVQQEKEDDEQEEDERRRRKNPSAKRKFDDCANGRCCNDDAMQSWDRNALLDSEINAEVLRIATEKME